MTLLYLLALLAAFLLAGWPVFLAVASGLLVYKLVDLLVNA